MQNICGKYLLCGHAVNSTPLVPLSAIASQSTEPTTDTLAQIRQLLDYITTPDYLS